MSGGPPCALPDASPDASPESMVLAHFPLRVLRELFGDEFVVHQCLKCGFEHLMSHENRSHEIVGLSI